MIRSRLRALIALLFIYFIGASVCYYYSSYIFSPLMRFKVREDNIQQAHGTTIVAAGIATNSSVAEHSFEHPVVQRTNCSEFAVWRKGVSQWFDDMYDESISPIWTGKNKDPGIDITRWWLSLHQSADPGNLPTLLNDIFQLIPSEHPYSVGDPNRCLRCAVVGNSGNLRQSFYGSRIDDHDYVMRVNMGPTEGFEEDVGRKTTHRFMYPQSYIGVTGETRFMFTAFNPSDLEWFLKFLQSNVDDRNNTDLKNFMHVDKTKIQMFNPVFLHHMWTSWMEGHGRYPSTGMMVLMFALQVCDQVNVFGYGATINGNWDHYYDKPVHPLDEEKSPFRITGIHDGEFEATVINKLELIGKIKVFKGARTYS